MKGGGARRIRKWVAAWEIPCVNHLGHMQLSRRLHHPQLGERRGVPSSLLGGSRPLLSLQHGHQESLGRVERSAADQEGGRSQPQVPPCLGQEILCVCTWD